MRIDWLPAWIPPYISWPILSILYLMGAGIGSISQDVYHETLFRIEYRGKAGRERWARRMEDWVGEWHDNG